MEGVGIDRFREGDKPFLLESIEAVMLSTYPELEGIGFIERRERAEVLLARYFEGEGNIDIARIDGERAGVLWWVVDYHPFTEERTAMILIVSVSPTYRRKGIARELLQKAREESLARGIKKLRLFVNPDNLPAWQLYRSLGFRAKITELVWY